MPRRVNAALAACLVGVSEKTMTAWLRKYGDGWGAQKHPAGLGRPEEWDIGMEELHTALAHRVKEERIQVMIEWIDLHRGTGGSASGALPPPSSSPSSAPSSGGSRRFTTSDGYLPGTFRTQAEAERWLLRHGIRSMSTPKDWRGWPPQPLTPENVLRLAIETKQRGGFRVTWRLYECSDDPGCVCHSVL